MDKKHDNVKAAGAALQGSRSIDVRYVMVRYRLVLTFVMEFTLYVESMMHVAVHRFPCA
jgi:hypothetical protein